MTAKLVTREARFGLTLDYNFLPIDFRDLRQLLAKNGYELAPVRNLPPPPNRISFSGEIARKKDTIVSADSEAAEIGVIEQSLNQAVVSFFDLIKLITDELGVDLYKNLKDFQVSAHYIVDTGKLPLYEIPKTENKEFFAKFEEIVGESLSSFSIRLARKDSSINLGDWFDIAIEPDVINEKKYHIGVVYRNSSREKTERFVRDLEAKLLKMLDLIEA